MSFTENKPEKMLVAFIAVLATILPVCFFAAIEAFALRGLSVYFLQLGLYLALYGLAIWGLKRERLALPLNPRLIVETLGVVSFGWLVYVAVLHLTGVAKLPNELRSLQNTPVWKLGAEILSIWFW
ncbi:MAG: hypothetical protein R6X34_00890 [Chloroflexota bacterium]|jgi:hypothetical protein